MNPLVVLDLDGTIIGASGKVEACVFDAVDRVRAAGVRLAVCTGRPGFGIAHKVASRIGPTNPHIFQNGAQITYPDGETLQVSALRESETRALIELARSENLVLEIYTPSALYVERSTKLSEAHARMLGVNAIVRDLIQVAATEPVIRAQWVVSDAQLASIEKHDMPGTERSQATSPALPTANFVSVTRAGVSKGSALRQLAEAMRVPLQRVLAVGDSLGDLPMLDIVGRPVAPANAHPTLLERFEQVAAVEKCGGAQAILLALDAPDNAAHR